MVVGRSPRDIRPFDASVLPLRVVSLRGNTPEGQPPHAGRNSSSGPAGRASTWPGPASVARSLILRWRYHCGGYRRLSRRPGSLQTATGGATGRQRHGFCARPASRSDARKHDGGFACRWNAHGSAAGNRRNADRARSRLRYPAQNLSLPLPKAPCTSLSHWRVMVPACHSASCCIRRRRSTVPAPSA